MQMISIYTAELEAALNSLTFARTVGVHSSLYIVGVQTVLQEITVLLSGQGNGGVTSERGHLYPARLKLVDSTRGVSGCVELEKPFRVLWRSGEARGICRFLLVLCPRDRGRRRKIIALESVAFSPNCLLMRVGAWHTY